jgi:hypothetical protein
MILARGRRFGVVCCCWYCQATTHKGSRVATPFGSRNDSTMSGRPLCRIRLGSYPLSDRDCEHPSAVEIGLSRSGAQHMGGLLAPEWVLTCAVGSILPTSPPTRCTGCGALLARGEQCKSPECQWRYSTYKTSEARTNDPRWVKVRAQVLVIDKYCAWPVPDEEICGEFSTEVDHLDGADKSDHTGTGRSWLNPNMCRGLCAHHHRVRTAQQSAMSRRRYES